MKKISFITNTSVNTLNHVKLLFRSLQENLSSKEHEILVFVDSDNEGTVDYLRSIKGNFKDLKIITHAAGPCVGYARNNNLLVSLSTHDIVSYLQSDMVVCKDYDKLVLEELEENCILSSTRIEPPLHGESNVTITKNLGTDPEKFDMSSFLKFSESVKSNKTLHYFFAPITFHKKTWEKIGGYDTLFRRSREDTDFLTRAIKSGIKIKQTFRSNVYHFTCVSSRGKNWFDQQNQKAQTRTQLQQAADQIELCRFIKKWGNFNHGEFILKKFDIDFVVSKPIENDMEFHVIKNIEPFVSRVWLSSEKDKEMFIRLHEHDHDYANTLLNFTKEDWERNKQFYNQIDYDDVFRVGSPNDFNIKLEVEFNNSVPSLQGIHQSLYSVEEGIYEFGPYKMNIKKLVDTTEGLLVVKNPEFDKSLLFIN
jgi:GT2 family glycosyltransferase